MKKGKLKVKEQDGKLVLIIEYRKARRGLMEREALNAHPITDDLSGKDCEFDFDASGNNVKVLHCGEKSLIQRSFTQDDIRKELRSNSNLNYALKVNKRDLSDNEGKFKYYFEKKAINGCEFNFDHTQIDMLNCRRERMFKSLNHPYTSFTGSPDWRLVVGLGNPSVYETSITLHHIYGFPYIPGSALKGITSHWAAREVYQDDTKEMKKALKEDMFRAVFGNLKEHGHEANKGFVTFHDALPIEPPTPAPDIMTPHYGDYYGKKVPPGDYLDPNRISFLTVKEGKFRFYLTIENRENTLPDTGDLCPDNVLKTAKEWLIAALQMGGVGAKSAVGYGYFNIKGETD